MNDPLPELNATEARVLGALIEKQITTPDNYPLTLNGLVNACNQLTNRDPVVSFDEQTIVRALDSLRNKRLATLFHGAESRVAKYRHAIGDVIPLTLSEVAVVCVLLLRGPQTVGEIRTRTERLFPFESLADTEATLNQLASHEPPIVVRLPRQPGAKESRFAHLLSGPVPATSGERATPATPTPLASGEPDRVARLEEQVGRLEAEVRALTQQFADFRRQFE